MAGAEPGRSLPRPSKEKKEMQISTGVREQNRQVVSQETM